MRAVAKLFDKSVVITGLIALCLTGVSCYLWAIGQPVPTRLWNADLIVLGFFFGGKLADIPAAFLELRHEEE